jgi:molybdopterin-synthase adenylyltransferase
MTQERAMRKHRYSRQSRVAGVGDSGQRKLANSTVLIVGAGALGTHLSESLVRAGVGTLHIVDRDIVEWSNLQRQVLFTEADAEEGLPKAIAAAQRLRQINSDTNIVAHIDNCSAEFLAQWHESIDLVLDGTDNFPTRYLLNDWCRQQSIPWIYAGAVGTEGASMVITAQGACLRCLWPTQPNQSDVGNCETNGILEPAIAAVTAFQSAEAIKLLLGRTPTTGVFTCDVFRGHYAVVEVSNGSADDCAVCNGSSYPALNEPPTTAATLCGRDAVQIDPPGKRTVDLNTLAERLATSVENLTQTPHLLRFEVDGCKFTVFPGGRALLFGVNDPLRARALYDRWLS